MTATLPRVPGPLRSLVLAAVARNPGCNSDEIAKRIDKLATSVQPTLSYLHERGYVTRQRKGRYYVYMLTEPMRYKAEGRYNLGWAEPLPAERAPEEPAPLDDEPELPFGDIAAEEYFRKIDALAELAVGLQGELSVLRRQNDDLGEWKLRAIERYPDLEEDSRLFKAREIVSELFKHDGGIYRAVLAGEYDNLAPVKAALAALRSATEV